MRGLQTTCQFEVVRGSATETIAALSHAGDIVVVMQPATPAERATQQFSSFQEAALRSAAAVLIFPPRLARQSGAVVAIAAVPNDPSVQAASEIARALNEDLVIMEISAGAAGKEPTD